MREPVTGGTIFWLNAGIDRGDIAYQEFIHIDPQHFLNIKSGAQKIWNDDLLPMGLKLFEKAFKDISNGVIIKIPQEDKYSTFEPSTDVKDIFKPDLLMLNP